MAKPLRTAEHLKRIGERLDRFEASVDERFARVDKRFDDQRSHFDTLAEASSDRFNNLYDLMTAQGEKTEERFNTLEEELRLGMTDVKAALQTLLAGQAMRRGRSRVS